MTPPKVVYVLANENGYPIHVAERRIHVVKIRLADAHESIHRYRLDEPATKPRKRAAKRGKRHA